MLLTYIANLVTFMQSQKHYDPIPPNSTCLARLEDAHIMFAVLPLHKHAQ